MASPKPASIAWAGLVGYVVTADVVLVTFERKGAERFGTMSAAFRDSLAHPIKRWPVIVAWGLLTFHLFDFFFPERVRRVEPGRACVRLIEQILTALGDENADDGQVRRDGPESGASDERVS